MNQLSLLLLLVFIYTGCINNEDPHLDVVSAKPADTFDFSEQLLNLKKYSSLLLMYVSNQAPPKAMGTCYFIKHQQRCFLVTNYHVINGGVVNNGAETPFIKIELLYYKIDNSMGSINLNMDDIRRTWSTVDIRKFPGNDVFIYEVRNSSIKDSVKHITPFIETSQFTKIPDSVIYFGFHSDGESTDSKGSQKIDIKTDTVQGNYSEAFENYRGVFWNSPNPNRILKPEEKTVLTDPAFLFSGVGTRGNSGSPVFGIFKDSNGNRSIKWIGMVSRAVPSHNVIYAIRPKQILPLIYSR